MAMAVRHKSILKRLQRQKYIRVEFSRTILGCRVKLLELILGGVYQKCVDMKWSFLESLILYGDYHATANLNKLNTSHATKENAESKENFFKCSTGQQWITPALT